MKMREEDSNWFSKWEEELPSPDELMPLSQTLITPDLALAFDIRSPGSAGNTPISLLNHHHSQSSPQLFSHHHQHQQQSSSGVQTHQAPPPQPNSSEFDSSSAELGGGGGGGGGGGAASEEPARTLKRPRLVWTPQLHKRFVDAVAHLGIKNAVPKTIMQLMSVDGLTRENVASHLQKYRLYLKRMQGLNNGTGGGGPCSGPGGPAGSGDPATDHLFASGPVPAHFLAGPGGGGGRPNADHFMPYIGPVAALHHQQMAAAHQIQAPYNHHHHHPRQMSHYGSGGGHFEQHPFLSRQAQVQLGANRNGNGLMVQNSGYVEDVESATANNGSRKVLTLFPTGDD